MRQRGVVTAVAEGSNPQAEQVVLIKIDGRGSFRVWPEDRVSGLDLNPPPLLRPGVDGEAEAVEIWNRCHPIPVGAHVQLVDSGRRGRVTSICDFTLYEGLPHVNVKLADDPQIMMCPMHRVAIEPCPA